MKTQKRSRLVRKRKLISYSGRGEIYGWLRVHHDELKELRLGQVRPWAEAILDMRDDLHVVGNPTSFNLNNVCNIWRRVCEDLAATASAAKPKRKFPSRISPNWRPQTVTPLPQPPPAPPADSAATAAVRSDPRAGQRDPNMTPEGHAELDRIWGEIFAEDKRKYRF